MPRAPVDSDVFNAIAEPRRRRIIELLAANGQQPVGDLVSLMNLPQPTVSKHLSVLREVGLVSVRRSGRQRVYSLNVKELDPVHHWIQTFERYWSHQTDRIKARAEAAAGRAAKRSD